MGFFIYSTRRDTSLDQGVNGKVMSKARSSLMNLFEFSQICKNTRYAMGVIH